MSDGLIHVYTGDGKGKTTASIGLAVRAIGANLKVLFVQFLKSQPTSELEVLNKNGVKIIRVESANKFIPYMSEEEKNICANEHKICYNNIKVEIYSNKYDLVVLDEIIPTISLGFIDLQDVITLLQTKPKSVELVLTGRDAPKELVDIADYVTNMQCLFHPYNDNNILARKGIEF